MGGGRGEVRRPWAWVPGWGAGGPWEGGSCGGGAHGGQEAGSPPSDVGLWAAEAVWALSWQRAPQPGWWVGWGPLPQLPAVICSQRLKPCLRSWGDSPGDDSSALEEENQPLTDCGQMGFRSLLAALGGWASPGAAGGAWDVSLGAWGPPAAAITHQHRPGTEQSTWQSPGPFPAPAPAPSALPCWPLLLL